MKLEVNPNACISCGACNAIAGEIFDMEDTAIVILDPIPEELEEAGRDAMEGCPTGAIYEVTDEKNTDVK
ncbi:MAG: ferredoxin [Bacilli bacterium]|nr:ferredoxin [Bacilli bacterium]